MKAIDAGSLFAFLFLATARGDLTLVQTIEGAGSDAKAMTIKIKGEKARIEVSPEVVTIIDSKTGEIMNIMMQDKKFLRISGEKARAVAELAVAADKKNQPDLHPQLKDTGRTETINGFQTEEYTCDAPAFQATYWIAKNYPDGAAIVHQLQAMTPQAWGVAGKGMPDYRDFPGVPLRSRVTVNGKEITSTLSAVKQEPLSDAEFQPPKGFEEMKMPDLESILGGKSKHARPSAPPKS